MVAVGETLTEPFTGCVPTPLLMETEVAFVVVHERVELCPDVMEIGFAEKLTVGAAVPVPTVMFKDVFGTCPELSHACTTT